MFATQKQVIDSLIRVRAFLEAHPAAGELPYGVARETLHEVLERIWGHAGTQVSARALGRAALRHERQQLARLRDRHMRLIVTTARAQIEPDSDVRLPVAFRMPRGRLGVTKMLQASDGMMEVARTMEAVLVGHGLPADFLARFSSDRDELERTFARRAALTNAHIGAGKGLQVELRRARLAVDRLDAIVRVAFDGDEVVLTAWRAAKRVHQLPGGAGMQAPVVEETRIDDREPVRELVPVPQGIATPPIGLRLAA